MNDWETLLREGDPAARASLSIDEAQAMRRAVLSAVNPAPASRAVWMQPALIAATVVTMLGAGVLAGRRALEDDTHVPATASQTAPETRQLQFATPGGTRIIWIFNSEFDLTESTP